MESIVTCTQSDHPGTDSYVRQIPPGGYFESRRSPRIGPRRWLIIVCLILFTGCGGYRNVSQTWVSQTWVSQKGDNQSENAKDSKDDRNSSGDKNAVLDDGQNGAKLNLDFESKPIVLLPGQFKNEASINRFKQGHWASANLRAIANNFDIQGQLHAYSVDSYQSKIPILGTDFHADSTRPVTLPKGQQKILESLVFFPKRTTELSPLNLQMEIIGPGGLSIHNSVEPVLPMKSYQYHLVALVGNNDEYKFLRLLDCVQIPRLGANNSPPFYTVVYPTPENPIPLAANPIAWTTIAYILWDQLPPEDLTEEQMGALLDWLHFGGQLIISGPNTLEKFMGTALEPYLPAKNLGSRNLSGEDFQEFNQFWATAMAKNPERRWELSIPEAAPMLGCDLTLNPTGKFVSGSQGLIAESQIGRGRIVVTAFPLSDKRWLKWPCFANLFNGALLRKPPRYFNRNGFDELTFRWAKDDTSIYDPLLGSTLRFVSRDLQSEGSAVTSLAVTPREENGAEITPPLPGQFSRPLESVETLFGSSTGQRNLTDDIWHYGGFDADPKSGVAGWSDTSGIASAARERIALSAGISPPSPAFVLRMLGVYLLVLVPINWLVFRLIGRVEWAWVAAPVISIIGAIAVVRMASLDIGFVRSQSQIGLLELFGGYDRGHLTEYSALYTSLSTFYEVRFDETNGVALPFAGKALGGANVVRSLRPVHLERTFGNRMRDFFVQSNSTGLLHSEDFLPLGGALRLDRSGPIPRIHNATQIDLNDAGLIWKTNAGAWQRAWIGELPAGSSQDLKFEQCDEVELYEPWKTKDLFLSIDAKCRRIWNELAGARPSISLSELFGHRDLLEYREPLFRYFRTEMKQEKGSSTSIVYPDFKLAYLRIVDRPSSGEMGLGEILDVIAKSLSFGNDEIRLLGRTESKLGQHVLVPQATQSNRSTLVLAHLQRPALPPVASDHNNLLDFLGKSDLDWMLESEDQENPDALGSLDSEDQYQEDGNGG